MTHQGNPSLTFSHYLLLSRVYKLEAGHSSAAMGQDDQDMDAEERPTKKSKKVKNVTGGVPEVKGGLFAYHPEEEFLEKASVGPSCGLYEIIQREKHRICHSSAN